MFSPAPANLTATQLYTVASLCFLLVPFFALLATTLLVCPVAPHPNSPHSFTTVIKPATPFALLDNCHSKSVCDARHYIYLVPLLVPVLAWFGIANWVGWEYFRYA